MRYEHNLTTGEVIELPDLPPAVPTAEELATITSAKLSAVRTAREAILNRLSGIALAAQLSNDTATTTAYVTVRRGLLDITAGLHELVPESVDETVMRRYALLVAQCTPSMISAFAQVGV